MEKKNNKSSSPSNESLGLFIGLLVLMVVLWAASGFLFYWLMDKEPSKRVSFADLFGPISALFSGAALAGVIYAVLLQRRELGLQRQELEETREELRRTAEAQEKSEKALVQQAEALATTAKLNALSLIPTVTCSVFVEQSKIIFTLSNPSINTVAYDVDVMMVGYYHEDNMDIPTFLKTYLVRDGRLNESSVKKDIAEFKSTSEEFYSVFDSLLYPLLPQRRKVVSTLAFPSPPFGILALLQYRDIQGTNYHQLYWFIQEKGYRVGGINPKTLERSPRIDNNISIGEAKGLVTEDGSPLPEYIENEFLIYWEKSLSPILVDAEHGGFEDRGEWFDL
ncbi:MAG: hypothetical protein ABR577_08645 [Pyrinomonadaceae bacterium]